MQTFDVAVIGLGAVGSAAAYQLSKTGLNIVGVDKHAPPHSKGSSHGESRITRQALGEGEYYSPLALRANEIWKELEQQSGQELYNPCGLLIISNSGEEYFETTVQASKDYGIVHELLDGASVTRRFPAISMYDDDVAYYEPAGGFLRPERCIEVQLKLAKENGVELRLNTEVVSIEEVPDGVVIHFADGTEIKAGKVITAQGQWVASFLPDKLKQLFRTQNQTLFWFDLDESSYERLKPGSMPVIMCNSRNLYGSEQPNFYGFPAIGGKSNGVKFAMHDTSAEAKSVESAAELLHKNVSKYVSGVLPRVLRHINCVYTVTPDEDFVIDFLPGSERIIVASPCSGHGFKHSAATGEVLAQLAARGTATIDIGKFSFGRF